MDASSSVSLVNGIIALSKSVFSASQAASDMKIKRELSEIYDTLLELKKSAAELEDENRELRESLRFKGEDFEFTNPFWYEKKHLDRPLCARCFSENKISPMGEQKISHTGKGYMRRCLVCSNVVHLGKWDSAS